jgi:hypothetical protein
VRCAIASNALGQIDVKNTNFGKSQYVCAGGLRCQEALEDGDSVLKYRN